MKGTVYDLDLADDFEDLQRILHEINKRGYSIVAVTQSGESYTVIFERPVHGPYVRY